MGHASSTYHVRVSKDLILRLLPRGREEVIRADLLHTDAAQPVFAYKYAFCRRDKDELPSEDALAALGAAMMLEANPAEHSDIPAGYTYLGQLIFHDITFMSPDRASSYRTPALDLDSILPSDELISDHSCSLSIRAFPACASPCLDSGIGQSDREMNIDVLRRQDGIDAERWS